MRADHQSRREGRASGTRSVSDTRLRARWLVLARVVWITLVALTLGFFVIGLPSYYQQLQTACHDATTCAVYGALNTEGLHALASLGFSTTAYAGYNTALIVFITLVWCVVGFIIFWHRADDWRVLLVAFGLIAFNPTYPGGPSYVLAMNLPALYIPTMLVSFLGQLSISFFFFLFPNGRFVPRWIAWFAILPIIGGIAQVVPVTTSFSYSSWPTWLSFLEVLTLTATVLFSQIYRYARISTAVQRQQTKWVVFGIVVAIVGNLGLGIFFSVFFQGLLQPNTPYQVLPNSAWPLVLLSIPVCTGIATLRHRLYDIDVIIRRTLIYSSQTALLAALYFGLIFSLQTLFQGIFHQSNSVTIVVSTLAIAALFRPLRSRIQHTIDRRFYRRKYDAAKTLAAFSATLRNEVDLGQLSEHLVAVVQETMQPSHVSLWLRSLQQHETQRSPWRATPPISSDEG